MRAFLAASTVLAVVVVAAPTVALSGQGQAEKHTVVIPESMKWSPAPPSLPPGAMISVLQGDPTAKSGTFVLRLKVPPGYYVAPHSHTTTETLTLVAGSMDYTEGNVKDRSKATALPTGSFMFVPARNSHAVWAGDQGFELEIQAAAPFEVHYVNPDDDPQKMQASMRK